MKYFTYSLIAAVIVLGSISLYPRGLAHAGDPSTSTTDTGVVDGQTTHDMESQATEKNQQSLFKAQPLPTALTYSLERQNLIDKAKFEAKQGQMGYVALIGPMGQLVAYYTVKGKVSSLNSLLTTPQQVKCVEGSYKAEFGCVTVDSPDLDGSYGANPQGIFFFSTSGQYIEWSGMYLYSDQPMSYVTQPLLVQKQ